MNFVKKNILETIGNTPIVALNRMNPFPEIEVLVKCEFFNPGGSIKDRLGAYLIERAEKSGELKPGGTIVEATSGNTGVGLAIAAAVKGYQTIFVMSDKMSEEKRRTLRAFGAKVVIAPSNVPPDSPESYYSVAKRLSQEIPGCLYTNQYHNLLNQEAHYQSTGPEIWNQMKGRKLDAVLIGMGTCGTISGVSRYLKEQDPTVKVLGIDPVGSILKSLYETGEPDEAHPYLIEGIGEDMKPGNCNFELIDGIISVTDKESLLMTRDLVKKEGLFCGTSSGAAVAGTLRYLNETRNLKRVLTLLPDSGNRYLSKVFDDNWMREKGILPSSSSENAHP